MEMGQEDVISPPSEMECEVKTVKVGGFTLKVRMDKTMEPGTMRVGSITMMNIGRNGKGKL